MTDILGTAAPAGTAQQSAYIRDSSIETFAEDVMNASREVPVIVDFWAPWCGPCKTLGPLLEKAVNDLKGKVLMVKVDIDQNQMLAQQLRIQSVPTVMLFIAGQPVDGFAGALPESQIKQFLERALQIAEQAGLSAGGAGNEPTTEEILDAADAALAENNLPAAAQLYGQLAQTLSEENEEKARALAGLAHCHVAGGNLAEARQMLELIPEKLRSLASVSSVHAMIDLAETGANGADLSSAQAAAENAPEDMDAQYAYAEALIGNGHVEQAADTLLAIVARDRSWNEEAARTKLVTLFEALGAKHPVTKDARRRLSSILFS
ncbi:thioredoxin [Parvularcula sp. IMCC14364]|uniref:thioredoxin n=1 Tax=Parvularcula sp. IMCC14364 TaxID=3067902 RepID=UPI0027418974|nr:thioredoxin [Parvularcula sp. IMCC14364]